MFVVLKLLIKVVISITKRNLVGGWWWRKVIIVLNQTSIKVDLSYIEVRLGFFNTWNPGKGLFCMSFTQVHHP